MLNPLTHRKILKKGRPGRATILAMSTPARGASSSNVAFTLRVEVEGLPPYEVEDQWMVSSRVTLGYGASLPVRVDPKDPQRVAIDWDYYMAETQAATDARRAHLASQPPVGSPEASVLGAPGDVSPDGAQTVDVRNDPELRAKLEQVLGRTLTPGTTEHIDLASDPATAAAVMQVIAQHTAERSMVASPAPSDGPDDPAQEPDMDRTIAQLERLDALRQSGAITQAEFDEQKRKLLG